MSARAAFERQLSPCMKIFSFEARVCPEIEWAPGSMVTRTVALRQSLRRRSASQTIAGACLPFLGATASFSNALGRAFRVGSGVVTLQSAQCKILPDAYS
jgi:hypothetical protein